MLQRIRKSWLGSVSCYLLVWGMPLISQVYSQGISDKISDLDSSSIALASVAVKKSNEDWSQWRGPDRTGIISGSTWPDSLNEQALQQRWSVALEPSYSGPIVTENLVFTTETKGKKYEVASAFDLKTGALVWSTQWEGAMKVPFFANANGDWIRSTPTLDEGRLYVGGMKDVLVCLDAPTGNVIWRMDFPAELKSPVPSFGFVCSPLIQGDYVYVQAGAGFCKLEKKTGKLVWRSIQDGGGMYGSAFSSPIIATICGVEQAVVQSREKLHGVDLQTGKELWSREIPTFRGMNIQTPIVFDDKLFVSTYGGTTQVLAITKNGDSFDLQQVWSLPAQGYMNTPVLIDGHIYIHLRNQRFACFNLATGKETWRSKPMGKYASMVANGDKIIALDERGELLLIRANPNEFELLSSRKVGDDSWAHVAVRGSEVVVRNLKEMIVFDWNKDPE
jgi:outer membrane protein assembly factor BamB